MLTENTYKSIYRSFTSNFEKDFFNPSYSKSIRLERASGYFTLSSLVASLEGLIQFIDNGGEIQLICNPELSHEDIELIDAGINLDKERITNDLISSIQKEHGFGVENIEALDIICNMISENRLQIKVAFKKRGIYHEKFGIFHDESDNMVYFNGSANQTLAALQDNFESFQVTCSWVDEVSQVIINEEFLYFNKMWQNSIDSLNVIDFPEAVKENLFYKYKRSKSLQSAIDKYRKGESANVSDVSIKKTLYPYQQEAINEFVANGYKHFYEMATGTGKTFTAVKTIERLREELHEKIFTIILVPQIDLQTQWKRALDEENVGKIFLLGGLSNNAQDEFNKADIEFISNDGNVSCVAVYDTYFSKIYNQIEDIDGNIFIIIDEAHNISSNQFKKLSKNIKYRLGLSATIKRFNENETRKINTYFTEDKIEPFYYGIEDAIEKGFLSRYNYYPVYLTLSDDEFKRYQQLTVSIATEMNKADEDRDDDKLERYRRDRSLVVKQASNKIDTLKMLLVKNYDFKNSVVYCGQGKDKESEDNVRIIDIATKVLGDAGLKVSQFTSNTPNRKEILENFESNFYDTLVAIKCLDEGVDIPKLDKIYIMSSEGNLRQTVQRRGRVLRKCKETGKTLAYIYDMITLPPDSAESSEMGASSLVKNEFRRVLEYNRLAENRNENSVEFEEILDKYNITEEDINDDGTTDK